MVAEQHRSPRELSKSARQPPPLSSAVQEHESGEFHLIASVFGKQLLCLPPEEPAIVGLSCLNLHTSGRNPFYITCNGSRHPRNSQAAGRLGQTWRKDVKAVDEFAAVFSSGSINQQALRLWSGLRTSSFGANPSVSMPVSPSPLFALSSPLLKTISSAPNLK